MSQAGEHTPRSVKVKPTWSSVEAPAEFRVIRVTPARRLEAARKLTRRSEDEENGADVAETAKRFLEAARTHGIDLTHLWASDHPRRSGTGRRRSIEQVCLAVPGPGRVAMVFTSTPRTDAERGELAQTIVYACEDAERTTIAQALIEHREEEVRRSLEGAGFQWIGDLRYLKRSWRPLPAEARETPRWPEGVEVRQFEPGEERALIEALERTYEDTMDCPQLCGLRSGEDVLSSHRAIGEWDPTMWWLVRLHGEPAGALLLNPNPLSDHTELVYLGLAPGLRGRGVARALVTLGLRAVESRRHRDVLCAVDAQNIAARRLYERFGFVEVTERVALVRPRRSGARVDSAV